MHCHWTSAKQFSSLESVVLNAPTVVKLESTLISDWLWHIFFCTHFLKVATQPNTSYSVVFHPAEHLSFPTWMSAPLPPSGLHNHVTQALNMFCLMNGITIIWAFVFHFSADRGREISDTKHSDILCIMTFLAKTPLLLCRVEGHTEGHLVYHLHKGMPFAGYLAQWAYLAMRLPKWQPAKLFSLSVCHQNSLWVVIFMLYFFTP
jgi:hypothetical protein